MTRGIVTGDNRAKYWNELDDSEKIERMRQEVKHLVNRINTLTEKIDELFDHRHMEDGTLCKQLERYGLRTAEKVPTAKEGEEYF